MNSYAGTYGSYASTQGLDINGNPCPPCPPDNGGGDTQYEDYTDCGPTTLEETDLYMRSLSVSDPRMDNCNPEKPDNFRCKVTRRVEVPFTRKVKVPTTTTKIVPCTVKVKVPVKKLVSKPGFKVVDEEYTVFEEREATRNKEIWVKQIVPEKYMKKVPVKMCRKVKKPTTDIVECDELIEVDVPSTKAIMVDGYRIDDVEDCKVVEVEEFQEFEYVAHPTGKSELCRTREIGRLPNSRIGRSTGTDNYHTEHPNVRSVDLDSNPGSFDGSACAACPPDNSNPPWMRGGGSRPGSRLGDPRQPNFANDNFSHTDHIRAAGKDLNMLATNTQAVKKASGGLGLSVKNTHTRHSDGTGVLVTKVDGGGMAALAGLLENDIITSVNMVPTKTVEEFAGALGSTQGSIKVQFNRDGRKNLFVHLDR